MALELLPAPPDLMPPPPPAEDTKYILVRTRHKDTILPYAGDRRFTLVYAQKAIGIDRTYDAKAADEQGPWEEKDVFNEATWIRWAGGA